MQHSIPLLRSGLTELSVPMGFFLPDFATCILPLQPKCLRCSSPRSRPNDLRIAFRATSSASLRLSLFFLSPPYPSGHPSSRYPDMTTPDVLQLFHPSCVNDEASVEKIPPFVPDSIHPFISPDRSDRSLYPPENVSSSSSSAPHLATSDKLAQKATSYLSSHHPPSLQSPPPSGPQGSLSSHYSQDFSIFNQYLLQTFEDGNSKEQGSLFSWLGRSEQDSLHSATVNRDQITTTTTTFIPDPNSLLFWPSKENLPFASPSLFENDRDKAKQASFLDGSEKESNSTSFFSFPTTQSFQKDTNSHFPLSFHVPDNDQSSLSSYPAPQRDTNSLFSLSSLPKQGSLLSFLDSYNSQASIRSLQDANSFPFPKDENSLQSFFKMHTQLSPPSDSQTKLSLNLPSSSLLSPSALGEDSLPCENRFSLAKYAYGGTQERNEEDLGSTMLKRRFREVSRSGQGAAESTESKKKQRVSEDGVFAVGAKNDPDCENTRVEDFGFFRMMYNSPSPQSDPRRSDAPQPPQTG